ncbi:MAG TPA: TRAP transporter small permease subunit, partial [Reyranella sp.]|nr:TRAP transporter small permease subunit [Reyranella sp.]
MRRLQSAAEQISRVGAIAGGAMLLVASILICIDITLRYTFAVTLGGADELSGYALAISSAWGFSSALLSRSHIRIDTVYV